MRRLGQGPIERDVRALRTLLGKYGLAQPGGWLPFVAYNDPSGISADSNIFHCTLGRSMTVRHWKQAISVATANDGSNYWTVSLRKNESTTIASFTTAADTLNTWTLHQETAIDEALSGGTDLTLSIRAEKTGAPGNLFLSGPAVFVT